MANITSNIGRVHSIETMGLLDGPGIRTVFFLQGCPMKCSYCHNPDTQSMSGGKATTTEEVTKFVSRYKNYHSRSGGGVTFSGGEPLIQGDFLANTLAALKADGVNTAIDTCGIGDSKYFEDIIKNTDLVILDIKEMNTERHFELTNARMDKREPFMKALARSNCSVWIRHVMVPGYTDNIQSMDDLFDTLIPIIDKIDKIQILPYHKLGMEKYESLKIPHVLENQGVSEMDKEKAKEFERYILSKFEVKLTHANKDVTPHEVINHN